MAFIVYEIMLFFSINHYLLLLDYWIFGFIIIVGFLINLLLCNTSMQYFIISMPSN